MAEKRKVLSVSTSDSSGGAARAAYRIHCAVQEYGIDSKMFVKDKKTTDNSVYPLRAFVPSDALSRAFEWVRNKVKNKWQHFIWNKYPNRSSFFMSDLRSIDIHGALQKLDYDVLHLHWINLRFLPLNILPKNKPIVWTLHDSWPFCGICHYFSDCEEYKKECGRCPQLKSNSKIDLSHWIWYRKKTLYNNLDLHIVSPSRWLGDCAKKSSLFGSFPVEVIPNCVDVDVFKPFLKNEFAHRWESFQEKCSNKPLVLYGAMNAIEDERKGFSYLLSALEILEKRGKGDLFELIVFGADKPFDNSRISIPIHDVGYVYNVHELASLYCLASITVAPSLSENLSCVIMESMSCGTPVVAFDIGGNGDMIDHKDNGYLAREKDSIDLADGILWCLENTKDGHLSENARRKVLENFTPEKVGEQYAMLYKSLIV